MQSLLIEWLAAAHAYAWMAADVLDRWVLGAVVPLAFYVIASGIDDLFVTCVMLPRWLRSWVNKKPEPDFAPLPEKRIAIVLPLWQEADVITGMVEHNVAAIDYSNYVIFAGVYANDRPTMRAVRALEVKFARFHVAVCPHGGPTSKADCLNWIYQRLLLYEEEHDVRFDILVTHDAEDLIHPESLRRLNYFLDEYDMVQVPVLALPTPFSEFTHGVYCDEFAEFQVKDMPARQALGSFIPSNGVGTGYRREALEKLAEVNSNRVFEPGCLTEDYENGLRLAELGCKQHFHPVTFRNGAPIATREYFPRRFEVAVRQRARWITGNALQAWERHGWRGGIRFAYWMWRDRKGLIGNPVSALTNLIFVYGSLTWVWSLTGARPWYLSEIYSAWWIAPIVFLQTIALTTRGACVTAIYGWRYALGVPLRAVWGNAINVVATFKAFRRYFTAHLRHQPLLWVKTEHAYPSRETLMQHKRSLEELLVVEGCVTPEDVKAALENTAPGGDWARWLVQQGRLAEDELYIVMSLQQGLPLFEIEPDELDLRIARALPAHVIDQHRVLPLRIEQGALWLAAPYVPPDGLLPVLQQFTRLEVKFGLITRSSFDRLRGELMAPADHAFHL